jgi:hypothetical protein
METATLMGMETATLMGMVTAMAMSTGMLTRRLRVMSISARRLA